MTTYEAIRADDDNKVVYDGQPISRHAWHGGSDTLEWGYRGSGPKNTALSILKHAVSLEETSVNSINDISVQEFMTTYVSPAPDDGWTIELSEVDEWLEEQS